MTSQRQRPAARRERSIPLRPRAIVKPLIRHDKVNAAVAQRFDAFCRSIDDRLFVDVEARVDEDRKAGLALECAEDIVVEGVVRPVDNLRPSRMVNVYNRWDTSAPFRKHVARYRHIAAGAPIDIRDIEDLASFFALDYGANGMNPPARIFQMK